MAASGERGHLRRDFHASIPPGFLTDLIARYREEHPHIKIEISESMARDALTQLHSDPLDPAFIAGKPELLHPADLDQTFNGHSAGRASLCRAIGGVWVGPNYSHSIVPGGFEVTS
ncbi:lysR substrate binding domain protein [Brucella grignonensis]|uniref:LysR substrate binding domain protein n=1 Tax=Brucella grignonensis TaxID=94627 RepID=A0A256EYN5_9HYPH|nr:lysR substrate binding domain protein [Brucella grignonensis]